MAKNQDSKKQLKKKPLLTPKEKKLAKQAKGLVKEHGDQIAKAVDKATDVVDDKTKGKYADQLEKVDQAAERLDRSGRGAAKGAGSNGAGAEDGEEPAPAPEAGSGA